MNDKIELLPCPFCGNSNVTEDEGCFPVGGRWEVRCGNPNCFASDSTDITQQAAIARWNRRAPNPEAQATEDAMRDALRMAVRQNSHDMLMTGEEIRECEAALRTPKQPEAQAAGELPADVQRIIDRDWFDYVDASHDAQQPDYSDSPTAREAAARELLAAGWKWEHNKWQQPAVVGDAVHVRTGVFDSSGTEICAGDRIVIRICGEHTKEEYWNPEYVVVWKAPRFTLKWVGGGKDSDTATWYFGLGTQQGYEKLEILERSAALTPAATPGEQSDEPCESALPDCGPAVAWDSEGIGACQRCAKELGWLPAAQKEGNGNG